LEQEQEALGIKKMELQVSCKTRWNSIYRMLQLNLVNRIPINRVLTQKKPDILMEKYEWSITEDLLTLLET